MYTIDAVDGSEIQLRLVVFPIIYKVMVSYTPGGADFFPSTVLIHLALSDGKILPTTSYQNQKGQISALGSFTFASSAK